MKPSQPPPGSAPSSAMAGASIVHLHKFELVLKAVNTRHVVRFELSDEILELLHDFLNPPEFPRMTKDEFQAYIDGKVKEVTDKITAEHDEVMTAIQAGGNATGDVPDSVKDALDGVFTTIAEAVGGVFTPISTPPPTGTPTPTPTDGSVVPPVPPADGGGTPVPSSVAP